MPAKELPRNRAVFYDPAAAISKLQKLIQLLKQLIGLQTLINALEASPPPPRIPLTPSDPSNPPQTPSNSQNLYDTAKQCIGRDVTPGDTVPDHVACVASLQEVYRRTFGRNIGSGAALTSTFYLLEELKHNASFKEVAFGAPGDIVICATGTSTKSPTPISSGHCGIVGKSWYMSNNSYNGLWEANYTPQTWRAYFTLKGGYPTRFFRVL